MNADNKTYDITKEHWELQDIFDYAWKELAKQGVRSVLVTGYSLSSMCAYRSAKRHKCAYGIFIPDSEYQPKFEGTRSDNLKNHHDYIAPAFRKAGTKVWAGRHHKQLALDLQNAHDSSHDAERITTRLRDVATRHGLEHSHLPPFTRWEAPLS